MTLRPGAEAPDFELELLGEPDVPGAGRRSLGQLLAEGPLLLIFAKSSCPTCQWCLPLLDRMHRNYGGGGVSVAAILQDSESQARWFQQDSQLSMPVLREAEPYPVSEAYEVRFVPTSYYVSPEGVIEVSIESFERESFKDVNARLAGTAGKPVEPLFHPSEGIPAFRPG